MTISLQTGSRVMFTGDSITDCHRMSTDNPLGYGYPLHVAGGWGVAHPDRRPVWLNSGISGNTTADLQSRWAEDVLAARPDVVSILIGINDCGYHFSAGQDAVSAEAYAERYLDLLTRLPDRTQLILVEPFLLPVDDGQRRWRDDLDAKIAVVGDLARRFGAELVRADAMFAELAAATGPEHWAADGVHPTAAGHRALADAWVRSVE